MNFLETRLLDGGKHADLVDAVKCLRNGGLVAFPTETVYGLGADALNPDAVERVFKAKGRPGDNPLIVHIGHIDLVKRFAVNINAKAQRLAKSVWPGPLTIVVERNDVVPDSVTAGLDTVALRVPRHPLTLDLLHLFDGGIVGPSGNVSGGPSPTTAAHVMHDLSGAIDIVLDGGPTEYGLESTVVDFTVDPPAILRKGALTREEIEETIGPLSPGTGDALMRSPGTRHRHYAPRARVYIAPEGSVMAFRDLLASLRRAKLRIGTVTHSAALQREKGESDLAVQIHGIEDLARQLYTLLRRFDDRGMEAIVVESCSEAGLGAALMDRLRRAAEPQAGK